MQISRNPTYILDQYLNNKTVYQIARELDCTHQNISFILRNHFPLIYSEGKDKNKLKRKSRSLEKRKTKCLTCKKQFLAVTAGRHRAKYCSRKCYTTFSILTPNGKRNYYRERAKAYYQTPNGHSAIRATTKRYNDKNKEKQLARTLLNVAVRSGRLPRPTACEVCGGYGQRIEAHHKDYSKPLEVMWLCSVCHGKIHNNELLSPPSLHK